VAGCAGRVGGARAYSGAVSRKPAGGDGRLDSGPHTREDEHPARRKVADAVVGHLLRAGIDGGGNLVSAGRSAERAIAKSADPEAAIDRIVATHTRLAAAGGFLTGLGGFITLPIALPANVVGFYVVATRMVASIAAVRGHDISEDAVRTTVLLTLTGNDASKVVRHAGIGVDGMAAYALRSVSPAVLMVVNKGVAFRLFVQLGRHGVSRFGHVVPVVGGFVGAAFDALLMRRIAQHAREHFPQLPTAVPVVRPRPGE
jgi:EcsC protein family